MFNKFLLGAQSPSGNFNHNLVCIQFIDHCLITEDLWMANKIV